MKTLAKAYGRYLLWLGSNTVSFIAGAATIYFMALLAVVERVQ